MQNGTGAVQVGDIVKTGDILVNGYLEGKGDLIINVKDRQVDEITDSLYIDIAYLSTFIIVIIGILIILVITTNGNVNKFSKIENVFNN